jgi:hypothetical protein
VTEPELYYALHVIPPGRMPFRRWRWELWHGANLLATGWRTSERKAEHALRTAAARAAHRLLGLHALRPEAAIIDGVLAAGAPARVECGGIAFRLVPRDLPEAV